MAKPPRSRPQGQLREKAKGDEGAESSMTGGNAEARQFENGPGGRGTRTVLLWLLLGSGSVLGCAPVGRPLVAPPVAGAYPPVREGEVGPGEAARVEALLERARDSLAAGAPLGSVELALEVLRNHPTAPGSAEALLLLAQGHVALGRAWEAAEAALELVRLLGPGHRAYPLALVLGGESLEQTGRMEEAAALLLQLPPSTDAALVERGRQLLRNALEGVPPPAVRRLAQETPAESPMWATFFSQAAVGAYRRGERTEAEEWARQALRGGPISGEDASLVRGVLEGRLEELLGEPFVIGVILSRSGPAVSPRQARWGDEILEGARLAVETRQRALTRPVRLEVLDDGGTPEGVRSAVEELERIGAVAAVGPLDPSALGTAAAGRRAPLPFLVPGAMPAEASLPGVLSLWDPPGTGARALARFSVRNGWRRTAILRPGTGEGEVESRAFREQVVLEGGMVVEELFFDPQATFFQQELRRLAALRPQALFLPLRPGDIPLLAPQITFFGLDTLGVRLLGTEAWTEREVLDGVDPRHTNGVVAVAGPLALESSPQLAGFRESYERFFQRGLRNLGPVWGYDALSLLLEALAGGARTGEEVWEALGRVRDFPGATGQLSVEGSYVKRPPKLVEIRDRRLVPVTFAPR